MGECSSNKRRWWTVPLQDQKSIHRARLWVCYFWRFRPVCQSGSDGLAVLPGQHLTSDLRFISSLPPLQSCSGTISYTFLLPICYLILGLGSLRRTKGFPLKRSALQDMSGDPLLRFIRDGEQCLESFRLNEVPLLHLPDRSLYDLLKVVEKNGPFLLGFSQIVALTIPRRSVVAGLLLVAILFPPLLK